ncbi:MULTISPECIES: Ig-like domain-containing protein [unclassified Streptomyces]|uniref:L,D-transpeptidase n=1 Tax=unclassified Streptomyces TaxID=2593676 RepID=UPI000DC21373|nr:Ig-like domain-containing protein [Streptomyces sp. PsTaAH-137]RAJ91679.1 lipoprotein-anchoring transpeptidase ErfK/SrfK [Streptomyces sp. PsTaAH-137]
MGDSQDRIATGTDHWSRRGLLSTLGAASLLTVAGCAGAAGAKSGSGAAAGSATATSRASVTVTPASGATSADFTGPVTVAVSGGTLSAVRVTADGGDALKGTYNDGRTEWTSSTNPSSGTGYTVTAEVDGSGTAHTSRFTTKKPSATFVGYFTPEDGSTSGVGMPVSLNFTKAVTDRAAVQKAVTVTADPDVEIVGHWFSDTRLDFRPETYWAAGTKITLRLRLKDVEGADGVYGTQDKDVTFLIGRKQISVVDLSKKSMTVSRDGTEIATYAVTGGDSGHETWAGKMVVSERFEETRMDSTTVGLGDEYDIDDVPHAQRLTTSGTFIHGNYWASSSIFGTSNTSHGCIGLRDTQGADDASTPGAKFYKSSMVGDVVEVRRSGEETVDPSNGLNGWNLSWADWKAGSAV